jgi:hypothetical protein
VLESIVDGGIERHEGSEEIAHAAGILVAAFAARHVEVEKQLVAGTESAVVNTWTGGFDGHHNQRGVEIWELRGPLVSHHRMYTFLDVRPAESLRARMRGLVGGELRAKLALLRERLAPGEPAEPVELAPHHLRLAPTAIAPPRGTKWCVDTSWVGAEVSTRPRAAAGPLGLAGDQRVLLAFLRRDALFDQVPEDRLGVVGVDPDPARRFAGFGARLRLQVGDHFAAAGAPRGAFTAGGITATLGLSAFSGPGTLTATSGLTFGRRRSLKVPEGPFELGLLFAEGRDVFFDQALGLFGLCHVVGSFRAVHLSRAVKSTLCPGAKGLAKRRRSRDTSNRQSTTSPGSPPT